MAVPVRTGSDALWYKDAIFYEVRIRSFFDSDGDGLGDIEGLTRKLDYIQDLGVNTIWLLPFYPSPLRDDGYDIADYYSVHPDSGTLADFKRLVKEAHKRGLRVVTELVINHTSDQHPWFQQARRGGPSGRYRDYYVWSPTPEPYKEARIIFQDFEPSNWTWDREANAYFWHRFFSHQPDLNFDNPRVKKEVFRVIDFWLAMGVDGMRLDAVPYLFEREGTNCENLRETHDVLKELRAHMDRKFRDRMLLAEANQWPEDAVAYFGDGDECNMCFHFPIMPRLFSAVQMEDRFPVLDILAQTPAIPASCQWAIFLRNHDELTLEMVTDEERDYMYRVYAHDRRMRVNLGIRRRLAPLMGNSRKKIELMNALILSLPGTPVLYYGDEIGMGDNFYLGDRNGVRTPMQWSGDRNAGFSGANPQRLFLPVIIDPEYHYETVNVEAQQSNPASLLWWMKRIIALRKRYRAFGRGEIEFLQPENNKVLVFLRRYEDELILVVANLSRFVQCVQLDLSPHEGRVPVELFGHTEFPAIGREPYLLSLTPHGFYWFALEEPRAAQRAAQALEEELPTLEAAGDWDMLLDRKHRSGLLAAIPRFLGRQSWFPHDRIPKALGIVDVIPVPFAGGEARIVLLRVEYAKQLPETFVIPLTLSRGERAEEIRRRAPEAIVANVIAGGKGGKSPGVLHDAAADVEFGTALLSAIAKRRSFRGDSTVRGVATPELRARWRAFQQAPEPQIQIRGKSDTTFLFGDAFALKMIRRVEEGVAPPLEMGLALARAGRDIPAPTIAGYLELTHGRQSSSTLAMLHELVTNQGTAWQYTLDGLGRYFDEVLTREDRKGAGELDIPEGSVMDWASREPPQECRDLIGPYLDSAAEMGRLTARLHLALATAGADDAAFVPEPFSKLYQRSLYQSMRNSTGQTMQMLRERMREVPEAYHEAARNVLTREKELYAFFRPLLDVRISAQRTRVHGDLHLGELLYTGRGFVAIDLGGDPGRSQSEHKIKRSPLRDVATMLRSIHYAAFCTITGRGPSTVAREEDLPALVPWARYWHRWVCARFTRSYLELASQGGFLPVETKETKLLLGAFMLERAIRELAHELTARPDWIIIPIRGIAQMLDGTD